MVVPTFHALQYLCVVWRYQLNLETGKLWECSAGQGDARPAWHRTAVAGLMRFALLGLLISITAFWAAPNFIDANAGYDRAVFGVTLFMAIRWAFTNIHHYVMDSVIWRHENPETRHYL